MTVDVLVAIHDPRRPLARCLQSVADQVADAWQEQKARVRARVVIHNTNDAPIIDSLPNGLRSISDFSVLNDGIASPAGPFNLAIAESTADYVITVGSDDALEPGAVSAWVARARETRADAVIASLRTSEGVVLTPYMRPGRRTTLHPVRDGLAYRTAPLGLLRRSRLDDIGFTYTEGGHLNGEDVEPALRLWFRGGRITYPYGAPCYRVFEDMGEHRATAALGPISREVGFLPSLISQPWLQEAPRAERSTIAVKIARAQLIGALKRRVDAARGHAGDSAWTAADAHFVARSTQDLQRLCEGGLDALSAWEQRFLERASCATSASELTAVYHDLAAGNAIGRVLPRRGQFAASRNSRARIFSTQTLTQKSASFEHPEPPAGWLERQRRYRPE